MQNSDYYFFFPPGLLSFLLPLFSGWKETNIGFFLQKEKQKSTYAYYGDLSTELHKGV